MKTAVSLLAAGAGACTAPPASPGANPSRQLTAAEFRLLLGHLCAAGYGDDVEWSENVRAPESAEAFAGEAIFVICNSGMKHTIARAIYERCMSALSEGRSAATAFGHVGKAGAIDQIWSERARLFDAYKEAADKVAFCASLPWIGGITKYHLAKNFGADVAKPDVHLQRLADYEGSTVQGLCDRLAKETGYRSATVDLVLWRACAIGLIDTRRLSRGGGK